MVNIIKRVFDEVAHLGEVVIEIALGFWDFLTWVWPHLLIGVVLYFLVLYVSLALLAKAQ